MCYDEPGGGPLRPFRYSMDLSNSDYQNTLIQMICNYFRRVEELQRRMDILRMATDIMEAKLMALVESRQLDGPEHDEGDEDN